MSITNLNQRVLLNKFQEINRNPSEKIEIYTQIREVLNSFLYVGFDYESEINSSQQKKLAENRQNYLSEKKARISNLHKPRFDHFEIDENMSIIDSIYNRLNENPDISEEYKKLLKDEGKFIKNIIGVNEPDSIITLNNTTIINVDKNKINPQEIEDFFIWQFNDTASDYFSVFQSIFWCIPDGQYLKARDYNKLRKKLFNYSFLVDRNYSGRKVLYETRGEYFDAHLALDYKIFWLTPDLKFKLNNQTITITSKLGEIHLRIESFFNMFVGDHDWETGGFDPSLEGWDDQTVECLMELNTDIFRKNLHSLHDEFVSYRTQNGSLVLSKSQTANLYLFFYPPNSGGLAEDSICFSRDGYDFFKYWEIYPEFTRYFVLYLLSDDHHHNIFLPCKHIFSNTDERLQVQFNNYYFKNMELIYNLLKKTQNKQLSWSILIIFLNNTLEVAYQSPHWVETARYIEQDFPETIKFIMNNFLRSIADLCPENEQTQYIKRIIKPTNLDPILDVTGRSLNTRLEHNVTPFIEEEESETLEFKQTFSVNTKTGKQKCEDIRYAALKEIVGFLNTRSGCLVIGIHDKTKEIIGIEQDGFKGDRDKFSRQINDLVATCCGEVAASLVDVKFHKVSGRTVCNVVCTKSSGAIYCKFKNNPKTAFIRRGSSTSQPDHEEWVKFMKQYFPDDRG
ncbi:ATP-binding protein [Paracoccaceae bacterium]|nr:ATP-binding protein [Paracoccaceae bacterium]